MGGGGKIRSLVLCANSGAPVRQPDGDIRTQPKRRFRDPAGKSRTGIDIWEMTFQVRGDREKRSEDEPWSS